MDGYTKRQKGKNKMSKEIFERNVQKEVHENNIDTSLFRKKSSAKSFRGKLIGYIKKARNEENVVMVQLLSKIYKDYMDFEAISRLALQSWKGKSSIEIIQKPDIFIVITYQKPSQDEEPREIKREIAKEEVNEVIKAINYLNKGEKINTRYIGERVYGKDWDLIFSDRYLHTQLNLILRLLDHYGITHYRGGYTTVLKKDRKSVV